MAPLRAATTRSESLPDDPTAFVPSRLWKLPFITTWDDSRNQNHPTDSAEQASFGTAPRTSSSSKKRQSSRRDAYSPKAAISSTSLTKVSDSLRYGRARPRVDRRPLVQRMFTLTN